MVRRGECTRRAINVVRCDAKNREPFRRLRRTTPYGIHVPVDEPSTALQADMAVNSIYNRQHHQIRTNCHLLIQLCRCLRF